MSIEKKEYLVGINYFAGWWRQQPNKYNVLNNGDWRRSYPGRTALLGCYNDQETMNAEIIAASEYGADFFMILWYVEKPEREIHAKKLNNGVRQFMKSTENHRMKFAVEFCNHDPYGILDKELWAESCEEWIEMMKHPSYLRVGGKSVFKVFGFNQFIIQCDNDFEKAKHRLEFLRRRSMEEGVGLLLIGSGVLSNDVFNDEQKQFLTLFDFMATYMDVPELPLDDKDYNYEPLLKLAQEGWMNIPQRTGLPYMPYLPAGWNPRPWGDPRPSFSLPNKEEWHQALLSMKEALDRNHFLRIPDSTLEGQKIFNIYAWNEFGEGGIIAPTIGDDWMKLEEVRDVFKI